MSWCLGILLLLGKIRDLQTRKFHLRFYYFSFQSWCWENFWFLFLLLVCSAYIHDIVYGYSKNHLYVYLLVSSSNWLLVIHQLSKWIFQTAFPVWSWSWKECGLSYILSPTCAFYRSLTKGFTRAFRLHHYGIKDPFVMMEGMTSHLFWEWSLLCSCLNSCYLPFSISVIIDWINFMLLFIYGATCRCQYLV